MSMIIAAGTEAQLLWMNWTKLVICVRVELSALAFVKAMRRKVVEGVQQATTRDSDIGSSDVNVVRTKNTSRDAESALLTRDKNERTTPRAILSSCHRT